MIPARRAHLPIAIALCVGLLVGRLGTEFETVGMLTSLTLLIAYFVLGAYVDAGKPKAEPGPTPDEIFAAAADEPEHDRLPLHNLFRCGHPQCRRDAQEADEAHETVPLECNGQAPFPTACGRDFVHLVHPLGRSPE